MSVEPPPLGAVCNERKTMPARVIDLLSSFDDPPTFTAICTRPPHDSDSHWDAVTQTKWRSDVPRPDASLSDDPAPDGVV